MPGLMSIRKGFLPAPSPKSENQRALATPSPEDGALFISSSPKALQAGPQVAVPLSAPPSLFPLPQSPPVPSTQVIIPSPAALQFLFPFVLSTLLNPVRPQGLLVPTWTRVLHWSSQPGPGVSSLPHLHQSSKKGSLSPRAISQQCPGGPGGLGWVQWPLQDLGLRSPGMVGG